MARYRKNPDHPRQRVNLTLDPIIYKDAQAMAYAEGVSVSEIVNQLLRAVMEERMGEAKKSAAKKDAAAKDAAKAVRKAMQSPPSP